MKTIFKAHPFSPVLRGYPVRINDYTWHIAVFVQEDEAIHYAEIRNKLLEETGSTEIPQ